MKMSHIILSFAALFSVVASEAASTRVFTCKGINENNNPKSLENFRVNILKNSAGLNKATFSEGFTTASTLGTWDVTIKEDKTKVTITSANKTPFELVILKKEQAKVDDIYGLKAKAKITLTVQPYKQPKKTYLVSGEMACK